MTTTVFMPSLQRFALDLETVRGTVNSSPSPLLEPCISIDTHAEGAPYELDAYTGTTVSRVDVQPTARWTTISGQTPFRSNGAVFYMLAGLLGTGSDATTGGGNPYTHTMKPILSTVVGQSYTIYHDLGDGPGGGNVRRCKRGTVTSLHFSADPGSPLMVDFSLLADMYDTAAMPVIGLYITDEMQMGYNGTISIPSGNAGAAYTCNITSADITLSRPTDPLPTIQGVSIKDITPGKLELSASINFEYDGLGAGKIHDDWTAIAEQGDTTHQASLKWTDENSHSIEFKFWPFRISDLTISPNGNYMSGTMTVSPYNNLTKALDELVSPIATAPVSVIVKNNSPTQLG
jgi:hypothetical protein